MLDVKCPSARLLAVGALGLGACAPGGDTGEPRAPSAWQYDGGVPDEQATGEQLSTAVQALVDRLLQVNAAPVVDSYRQTLDYSMASCPAPIPTSSDATGDMTYWDGMCLGDQDVWFKGPMTTWAWEDIDISAGTVDVISEIMASTPETMGFLMSGAGVRGQTDIFNADGSVDFNCSCTAMVGGGATEDGRSAWFSFMDGPAHWTGSASDGTWLADGLRPGLWIWAELNPVSGYQGVTVAGNLTGFTERFDTARLDLSVFRSPTSDKACVGGVMSSFTLRIRDADTADWYDLDFEVTEDTDRCLASATSESGETVTVDLSDIVGWEESPW